MLVVTLHEGGDVIGALLLLLAAGRLERRVDELDHQAVAAGDVHVDGFLVKLRGDLVAQRQKIMKELSPFGKLLARSAEQQDAQQRRHSFVHESKVYDGLSCQLTVGGWPVGSPPSQLSL